MFKALQVLILGLMVAFAIATPFHCDTDEADHCDSPVECCAACPCHALAAPGAPTDFISRASPMRCLDSTIDVAQRLLAPDIFRPPANTASC